jgi:hypothetical protein
MFRPDLIISGGQTGADAGALIAAHALGIRTGGYAPKGWLTEVGPAPWLGGVYGLVEHVSDKYVDRTAANIRLADATVIFGRPSRGSSKTLNLCECEGKPVLWITANTSVERIRFRLWLARHQPKTLNIAGNRESVTPGIGKLVQKFLMGAFS